MTLKEIAAKVLLVMDMHENSFESSSTNYGSYNKTIRDCYDEIFGKDNQDYQPYYLATHYCWNDMQDWANYILSKND